MRFRGEKGFGLVRLIGDGKLSLHQKLQAASCQPTS